MPGTALGWRREALLGLVGVGAAKEAAMREDALKAACQDLRQGGRASAGHDHQRLGSQIFRYFLETDSAKQSVPDLVLVWRRGMPRGCRVQVFRKTVNGKLAATTTGRMYSQISQRNRQETP